MNDIGTVAAKLWRTRPGALLVVTAVLALAISAPAQQVFEGVGGGTDGDYMVFDLSGGPSASSYTVSYMSEPPAGGWTDEYKTTKLVMRRIPAGTFAMGSPMDEVGRWSDREAERQVTLTEEYYIGVFQVTQRQWERVMGDWPSFFNNTTYRDARPLETRSWNDIRGGTWPGDPSGSGQPGAGTFIQILRAKTGLTSLDLPTEAQWERAGRAGTGTALSSGKNITTADWDTPCPHVAEVGRHRHNHPGGYSSSSSVSTDGQSSNDPNNRGIMWGFRLSRTLP